jgi:predicted nuclease of restriction endonuclease-like RecB superfamily
MLDTAETAIGQPWRVLLERLEVMPLRTTARRVALATGALRYVLDGRKRAGPTARVVRGLVLGSPALDVEARALRLAAAATRLGTTAAAIEAMLWSDLPRERPVGMSEGRPSVRRIAAIANVAVLRRALARAHHVRLRIWGDARELVRIAAMRGLLVSAAPDAEDSTTIDVTGPVSLFHDTTVYGRALGALIAPLAELDRFELEIRCDLGRGEGILRVAPPVLLPNALPPQRSLVAIRLARDLAALGCEVVADPAPIVAGDRVVFPELQLEGRWSVEILGFATADYMADRIARYRAAGANLIVCLDVARSPALEIPAGAHVVPFRRRIDAAAVLAQIR